MSTSSPRQPDRSQPLQPSRVFDQLIWTNPEVCNNCFRQCKTTTRFEYGDSHHDGEYHDRTPDGCLGSDVHTHDPQGAVRTYPPRTTCRSCGSVRLLAQYDTLSTQAAVDRVPRLADRLDEHGIPVDRDVMYQLVRQGKQRESVQGYDRELFASAVKLGVQRGGPP